MGLEMSIYAISDLHLSFANPKPMDIFGSEWRNHAERIAANWDETVREEDTVLVAGDHSWALHFEHALPDLDFIAHRPGRKILIRGNHDYWWRREQTNKIQSQVHESIFLMQGRSVVIENVGITGTRGWRIESAEDPDVGDVRVMQRELNYLARGLREMPENVEKKIVMLHYPPFDTDLTPNAFAEMLKAFDVDILVYGHIHSGAYLEGDVDGIRYRLVSVDHVGFRPVEII
ncbi:MAG: metallophosphoesterase [Chloroflexi bacterium]|nr:metallophosphoesterase [Chloroflexota bacterium]